MAERTEEQMKDFEERKKKFLDGYKVLMDEHKIDIYPMPEFVPDGKGAYVIRIISNLVDTKELLTPSNMNDFL